MLFTGVMGLLLIIASFLLNMANGIPFFGNKFTFNHLDFGFHIGIWFMIMFASCSIYFYSWKLFILCFIIFEVIGAIRRSKERK